VGVQNCLVAGREADGLLQSPVNAGRRWFERWKHRPSMAWGWLMGRPCSAGWGNC